MLIGQLEKEFPKLINYADKVAIESAWSITERSNNSGRVDIDEADIEDFAEIESEDEEEIENFDDYYEDYLPDYTESLRDPSSPHLEP